MTDICGADADEIEPDMNLFDEELLDDSFGVIQLVLVLEEAFDISLEIENIPHQRLSTLHDIEQLVQEVSV